MKIEIANMNVSRAASVMVMVLLIGGCAMTPPTIVQRPTTSKPERTASAPSNGSIYQVADYRPLFEDPRARSIGDVITMTINENTSAGKAAAASDTKAGSAAYSAPQIFGLPAATTAKLGLSTTSSNKFSDAGAITSSNNFTSTMGLTVLDVLPNGNLVVSGEKQIALDKSVEYIRFSGVVSPQVIVNNTVSSTQVADARVEYRTNSHYDSAEVMSELSRFVMSVAPF
jgi:flagellar L-ring protein precursor FlgH